MKAFLQQDGDTYLVRDLENGFDLTDYRIERLRRPERYVLMHAADEVGERPSLREARELADEDARKRAGE